jgi:hypothetical protein
MSSLALNNHFPGNKFRFYGIMLLLYGNLNAYSQKKEQRKNAKLYGLKISKDFYLNAIF